MSARVRLTNHAYPAQYLATFTIRASNDADGNHLIQAKAANTHFRGGNNKPSTETPATASR